MFQKYFFIVNYFAIIVFAVFFYKKYAHSLPLKLFLVFLVYSFFTEVAGTYFSYFSVFYIKSNFILYNAWNMINPLFYALFFISVVTNKIKRKLIFGLTAAYVSFTLINIFFRKDFFNQYFIDNIIVGGILIVLVIMIYFTELLNSDAILNIKNSLIFWIGVGILLANIILLPVWVFADFFSYQGIFRYLIFGSNIITSLCFITGFIMSKKQFNV